MYTVPIAIHPSNGDTSKNAHTPQKPNIMASAMIRRLSPVRVGLQISSLSTHPSAPPSANIARLYTIGSTTPPTVTCPATIAIATPIAAEKATSPTTSSNATTCNSVSTKSPLLPV